MEDIIKDFIEWAKENSPDAWWVFEDTDEAIEKYKEHLQQEEDEMNDEGDNFLGDAGS